MHNVLVLGGSGLIGKALINEMDSNREFQIYSTYFEKSSSLSQERSFKLNIEDLERIIHILNYSKPQSIISCLRGDFDKQLILHIKVAEYLKENGGNLYFFSTANVFDNDMKKPHFEDDLPNSNTKYGRFKIECENKMIEILGDNARVLRLPQVWGKNSTRMNELLQQLHNNKDIVVYPRLFLNTNTDVMIAKQLRYIIENNLKGTFHLSSDDIVNNKEFYEELASGLGFNHLRIEEKLEEEGYFALLSKRESEFPKQLRLTNKEVIKYLREN